MPQSSPLSHYTEALSEPAGAVEHLRNHRSFSLPFRPASASFPRRRESRRCAESLSCWVDSRLRGNDKNDRSVMGENVLDNKYRFENRGLLTFSAVWLYKGACKLIELRVS